MIVGLKPYPAMKTSGGPWLGDIPRHWEVAQLGRIGRIFKGKGGSKEDEVPTGVPCVRYGDLYTKHRYFVRKSRSFIAEAKAIDYTPIEYGDVLFAGSGETLEEIGKSAVNLIEGSACCGGDVIVLRPEIEVNPSFLGYAADYPYSVYQKSCMGRGITVMHIYSDELKYLTFPLPPLPEQAAIVRYLDHVDRRINRYVRAKRRLIELLTEQKRAVIHRAVTRGLDPDARLKPSSVDWLRDVPENWAVRTLKTMCSGSAIYGANIPATSYVDRGIRFLRTTDITDDGKLKRGGVFLPSDMVSDHVLSDGDILFSRSGTVGRTFLYKCALHGPCAYAGYLVRFVPKSVAVPEFIFWFTKTPSFYDFLKTTAISSTIENVSGEKYANMPLPLPSLAEQSAIVNYLNHVVAGIDTAIDNASREAELLQEYRTRLIADVVTGKLDVREAAPALPEIYSTDLEDIIKIDEMATDALAPELDEVAT